MISSELKVKVDRLWDVFWSAGVSNPLEIVEQITYLMFIQTLDPLQRTSEQEVVRSSESFEHPGLLQLDDRLRWSRLLCEPPQQMYSTVRDAIFPWLRSLAGENSSPARHFGDARLRIPTPGVLAKVVDALQTIPVNEPGVAGDVYDFMLSKIAAAGWLGQFTTPRHVARLMVEMTAPRRGETICDPACGTGGLLVAAAEYMSDSRPQIPREPERQITRSEGALRGIDIDGTMLRLSAMNMYFHGIGDVEIRKGDSIARDVDDEAERYSVILTHPPFAGNADNYDVSEDLRSIVSTRRIDILFVARTVRMLKPGGRAAILVPEGFLFGSTAAHTEMRRTLIEDLTLEAVIKLPSGAFKPYAGIASSILFLKKSTSERAHSVWFYEVTADGWSLDDRRIPLLPEEKLGPSPDIKLTESEYRKNNLPDLVRRWALRNNSEKGRKPTEQSFFVSKSNIRKAGYDLSLTRYRQIYETKQLASDALRLGDFAEIFAGSVIRKEIGESPGPSDADRRRRVLTPSLLDVPLPEVNTLPLRTIEREVRVRLREGDIVGRDLATARHWTILPADYEGVQPGKGLVVIRLLRNPVPPEYLVAYLSSPQAERQFPVYGVIPHIKIGELQGIRIPKCAGDFEDVRASIARLGEGEFEADRIRSQLREARIRIFEQATSGERLVRLNEAADFSSLIAQSLQKQSNPYWIFQETYPYGIARAVRKFKHSMSLAEKHESALQCVESLILSLGIFSHAIAAHWGRQNLPEIVQWKQSVGRGGVSLGHWVAVIRAVGADARENGDRAAGLAEATAPKKGGTGLIADLGNLVTLRNKVRHGAGPRTRAEIEKSLDQLEQLMFSALSGCAFLARARWIHMDRLRWLPDVGKFEASGLVLMGDHPDFEPIAFQTDQPLADNGLYVLTQQGEAIPLSPFCLLSDCPTCLAPELYYPDRLTAATALLKSLDRGHELESDRVSMSLRPWIES